jgi:hypothetical protein
MPEFCLQVGLSNCRDLSLRPCKILRYGASGCTSPQKEVVLRTQRLEEKPFRLRRESNLDRPVVQRVVYYFD